MIALQSTRGHPAARAEQFPCQCGRPPATTRLCAHADRQERSIAAATPPRTAGRWRQPSDLWRGWHRGIAAVTATSALSAFGHTIPGNHWDGAHTPRRASAHADCDNVFAIGDRRLFSSPNRGSCSARPAGSCALTLRRRSSRMTSYESSGVCRRSTRSPRHSARNVTPRRCRFR